jgi:hypothetical protein
MNSLCFARSLSSLVLLHHSKTSKAVGVKNVIAAPMVGKYREKLPSQLLGLLLLIWQLNRNILV